MTIFDEMAKIPECEVPSPEQFQTEFVEAGRPFVFRGLVADWPIVAASAGGRSSVRDVFSKHWQNHQTASFHTDASSNGRFTYTEDLRSFNFDVRQLTMEELFDRLESIAIHQTGERLYAGSLVADRFVPGFTDQHPMPFAPEGTAAFIWIGNQTRVAAHFDIPKNIACVAAGTRRFTLFPPDQVKNLYIGPLDKTPAGQPISLIDFHEPDFEQFPKFREALTSAQTTTLNPGDAIYIPSLWWHHVESLDDFGVLINYWWRNVPSYVDSPMNVLTYALMALKELPSDEKLAWKAMFDHFIFSMDDDPMAHLPEAARGVFGALDQDKARALRGHLLSLLNR